MCKKKTYHVADRIRNNLMLEAVEKIGERFGPQFCVKYGIDYLILYPLIALKTTPYDSNGDININVIAFMEITGTSLSDIFTEEQLSKPLIIDDNVQSTCDIEDLTIKRERKEFIEKALSHFTHREVSMIKMYFGIDCESTIMSEIASKYDISANMVAYILNRAMRKMRHPKFGYLREVMP